MHKVISIIIALLLVASVGVLSCAKEEVNGPASDALIFKEISSDLAGKAVEQGDCCQSAKWDTF